MKFVVWSGVAAFTLMGLTACDSKQAQSPTPGDPQNTLQNPTSQAFSHPIVPPKSKFPEPPKLPLATVPVKGLVPSSRASDRSNQIELSGGRDPFATVLPEGATLTNLTQFSPPSSGKSLTPVLKKPVAKSTKSSATTPKSKPKVVQPIARRFPTPLIPLSAIPPVQVNNNLPPLPAVPGAPIGMPSSPQFVAPPSPTALADEVEVTGVIQAGDRVMAIIKAPDESTARYVNSGDTLSGGRVIVREIRVGQAGQPTVVLEQNGQRVTKSLGAIARMTSFRGL